MKKSFCLLAHLLPIFIFAQQHPLPVEPAALLEAGHAQVDFGIARFNNQPYPLSGLTGNLWKFGNLKFAISLSGYVEIQTDGTLLNILKITKRDTAAYNYDEVFSNNPTGDIGDFSLWTKFIVLNEYSSGIGISIRFGTQLPNTSNESGLGIDEMNFFSSFLIQKHFAGVWIANIGLGILGDPVEHSSQHDVLLYALAYTFPVTESTMFTVQTTGRRGHEGPGIYHLSNGKFGIEKTFDSFTVHFLGITNFSSSDNSKGVELTLSYLFRVMDIK